MKKQCLLFVLFFPLYKVTLNAQPTLIFNKTFGGSDFEAIYDITDDGNNNLVLLAAATTNGGDVNCNIKGELDVWLVCIDLNGNILWQQCYGGSDNEEPNRIIKTADHGFLFTGQTFSNDGDVSGNHGGNDVWIVKLDSSGIVQWQRSIGSAGGDFPKFSMQLQNGKYLVTCTTLGNDGDFPEHYDGGFGIDAWIVILNQAGSTDTLYHYGGSYDDYIREVIEKPNGDRVMVGYTDSYDYDLQQTFVYGSHDGWIFKTDSNNVLIWKNRWGGSSVDGYISVLEAPDGGFLLAGATASVNDEFAANHGDVDLWLVKADSLGNKQWQKFYGGTKSEGSEYEDRISKINSNLFVLGSWTNSDDGDVGVNLGKEDYWFLAVDSMGNIVSSRVSGGTDDDYMYTNKQILSKLFQGGLTTSSDVDIPFLHGDVDGWLIEFGNIDLVGELNNESLCVKIYPNPFHEKFFLDACPNINYKKTFLEIFSLIGVKVMRIKIEMQQEEITLPAVVAGTYLYELKDQRGNKLTAGKLIVK